jgi:hypothetical protein
MTEEVKKVKITNFGFRASYYRNTMREKLGIDAMLFKSADKKNLNRSQRRTMRREALEKWYKICEDAEKLPNANHIVCPERHFAYSHLKEFDGDFNKALIEGRKRFPPEIDRTKRKR